MTGLRTIWGVSLQKVENDFGVDYKKHLLKVSQKYIDEGLLVTSSDFDFLSKLYREHLRK